MSTETNKAVVWRMNKEFIEGRSQKTFDEIIAENFIDQTAMPGMSSGPAGVKAFFGVMWQAFPDMTVEIFDQVAQGDMVVTRKAFHGTHDGDFMGIAPTHKRVQINVMDRLRLENGR